MNWPDLQSFGESGGFALVLRDRLRHSEGVRLGRFQFIRYVLLPIRNDPSVPRQRGVII